MGQQDPLDRARVVLLEARERCRGAGDRAAGVPDAARVAAGKAADVVLGEEAPVLVRVDAEGARVVVLEGPTEGVVAADARGAQRAVRRVAAALEGAGQERGGPGGQRLPDERGQRGVVGEAHRVAVEELGGPARIRVVGDGQRERGGDAAAEGGDRAEEGGPVGVGALAEDGGGIHADHVDPRGGEGDGLADGAADPVGEGRAGVRGGEVDREREARVVQGVGEVGEVGRGSEAGAHAHPGHEERGVVGVVVRGLGDGRDLQVREAEVAEGGDPGGEAAEVVGVPVDVADAAGAAVEVEGGRGREAGAHVAEVVGEVVREGVGAVAQERAEVGGEGIAVEGRGDGIRTRVVAVVSACRGIGRERCAPHARSFLRIRRAPSPDPMILRAVGRPDRLIRSCASFFLARRPAAVGPVAPDADPPAVPVGTRLAPARPPG
ncbi:hypothetical protein BFL35_06875 [Clavibacter michiganensis]|nr:hypothetical protein BFL35_06875 [Clavibacter michiganensis]